MEQTVLILYILGFILLLAGATLIVLVYTTDILDNKTNTKSAGVGSLISDASITWDETGIITSNDGSFVKWASTTAQTGDTSSAAAYKYDIGAIVSGNMTNTATTAGLSLVNRSNSGAKGITTTSTVSLGSIRTASQTWSQFPKLNSTHSIVIVYSSDSKPANGVFYMGYTSSTTLCSTQMVFAGDVTTHAHVNINGTETPEGTDVLNFRTYGDNKRSSNVFGYTYDGYTIRVYINGALSYSRVSSMPDGIPKITLNSNGTVSTIYSVLVYDKIKLEDSKMGEISSFLADKYFAPAVQYPVTCIFRPNELVSIVNSAVVAGADPIKSYSISPELPTGLTLNTTTGAITGTPTVLSATKDYTITVKNNYTEAASTMGVGGISSKRVSTNISVSNTIVTSSISTSITTTISTPTITFSQSIVQANIGQPLQLSMTSTGVTAFSIVPANITELTGLSLDINTGVLSGTVTKSANISVTITGSNSTGSSSTCTFQLRFGVTLEYSSLRIDAVLGKQIVPLTANVFISGETSVLTGTFIELGSLFGLTFDPATGRISGTPTSVGSDTLAISVTTTDGKKASVSLPISITNPKKEPNKKNIMYVGIGGGAAAIGLGLIGTGAYLSSQSIPQSIPQSSVSQSVPQSVPQSIPQSVQDNK